MNLIFEKAKRKERTLEQIVVQEFGYKKEGEVFIKDNERYKLKGTGWGTEKDLHIIMEKI